MQTVTVGQTVWAWRNGKRAPATVIRYTPKSSDDRKDTLVQYVDDATSYVAWSKSLTPRWAPDLSQMTLPPQCETCGDAPRAGSRYCSEKCEAIALDVPYGSEGYADL